MSDYDHPNLTLHGRYVHDELTSQEKASSNPREQGAPAYEIGVEIEGVFVPIFRRRSAAGLKADIERVKKSRDSAADSSQG